MVETICYLYISLIYLLFLWHKYIYVGTVFFIIIVM